MKSTGQILSSVKNQICWRPWRGGRDAIFFEFGDKLPNKPGDKELRRGTYTIGITPCPWQIFKDGELFFNDQTEFKKMDELQKEFENQKLLDIEFDKELHEESIIFSGGLTIRTYHNRPDDEWHILTPDATLVVFKDRIEISPAEGTT